MLTFTIFIQHSTSIPRQSNWAREVNKGHLNRKGGCQLVTVRGLYDLIYQRVHQNAIAIYKPSKVAGSKANVPK